MLSKRVIGVILLRDGRAVKSKQFKDYRDVGDPVSQARIYYANGIDELVILNTQGEKGIQPLLDVLPKISEQCFIPIAAGGGIKTANDAMHLIVKGADKVVIRTAVDVLPDVARRLGRQSVVQCFDYEDADVGTFGEVASEYAGERLFQCISRDGMMTGYDNVLVDADVPVILLGGCGNYAHMLKAFNQRADACAAASLWAFTDSNPIRAKKWLKNNGVSVRT